MRTTFLVDGFNLYFSAVALSKDADGATTKWLDLKAMLSSCLSLIDSSAALKEIHYFSAVAHHRESRHPGSAGRHERYLEAIRATGVIVELGRFKRKYFKCYGCQTEHELHEEKETDVAIGMKLLELFHQDECDAAVLVTGDTDLTAAVRTAKRLFPSKKVFVAFPYRRKNDEFLPIVDGSFRLKRNRYLNHQFPDPFKTPSGKQLAKPSHW